MSVTTVPIRPIEKGTLTKMWIGIATGGAHRSCAGLVRHT